MRSFFPSLFGVALIICGCNGQNAQNSSDLNNIILAKDTIDAETILNEIKQGSLTCAYLNEFGTPISPYELDTFYIAVSYNGSNADLNEHHEMAVYPKTDNMRIINNDRKGRFKVLIDESSDIKYFKFDVYLISHKYLFKIIDFDSSGTELVSYEDNMGLRQITQFLK